MVAVEEIRGGHSPMMQLNGTWNVDKNIKTENNSTSELSTADGVWFNATVDQGSYCKGQWLQPQSSIPEHFLWSFSPNGNNFYMEDTLTGQQVVWTVLEQKKNHFDIQRTENGVTYEMVLSK